LFYTNKLPRKHFGNISSWKKYVAVVVGSFDKRIMMLVFSIAEYNLMGVA